MHHLHDTLQDIRFGLRMLRKNPGFAAVTVLTLALGIGANTAVFSVANTILLRPLGVPDSGRLVMVWSRHAKEGRNGQASPLDFVAWQEARRALASIGAIRPTSLNLTDAGEPVQIRSGEISSSFLPTLGVSPILGSLFGPRDFQAGRRVALISVNLWRTRFGSDPARVGRSIRLNGELYAVLGVLPEVASFPVEGCSIWTPLRINESRPDDRHFLYVLGRLRDGVSVRDAQNEITVIARNLEREYPDSHTGYRVAVESWRESMAGPLRPVLAVLFGAVGFVLLIACANVANLLLARNSARTREFAVRVALGASRGRLVRQLLTEGTVLSVGGGVLGVFFAHWGVTSLLASLPSDLPVPGYIRNVGIDGRVLIFVGLISVVTAFVFGILPASRVCQMTGRQQLAGAGRSVSGDFRHGRMRRLLIVGEIALTMTLLFSAAVLTKNLLQLRETDPGLVPTNVLTMTLALPNSKFSDGEQRTAFYREAEDRLAAIPGVRAVGAINNLPFRGRSTFSFTIEGTPRPNAGEVPQADERVVSPGYFKAMGVAIMRGRAFSRDDGAATPPVVVVNQALARRYFGNADALWPARALTVVQSVLGLAALLMAAIGLHGVIAYSVGLRRREFGVRLALGARPADLAGLVLGQGVRLLCAGLALGLTGTFALGRVLRVLMPQGGRSDPAMLGGVVLFLVIVTLLACWLPAQRASRIDPMVVLSDE